MNFYNEEKYLKNPVKSRFIKKAQTNYEKYCKLCEDEYYKYAEVLEEYDNYIKKVALLIKELSLNNSISESITICSLIDSGCLSYKKYERLPKNICEEIISKFGLSVVLGNGVCRNTSSMHKDIFDNLGEDNRIIYVSTNRLKHANHMVNLIVYDGVYYAYDTFNKTLLKFNNSVELESYEFKLIFKYIPYDNIKWSGISIEEEKNQLMAFKENSRKNQISDKEFLDIKMATFDYTLRNIKAIQDFEDENEQIKHKIKSLYEIKKN